MMSIHVIKAISSRSGRMAYQNRLYAAIIFGCLGVLEILWVGCADQSCLDDVL